jgi:hypothetical protein
MLLAWIKEKTECPDRKAQPCDDSGATSPASGT